MTQRRQVVLQFLTYVLVTTQSEAHTTSTRLTSLHVTIHAYVTKGFKMVQDVKPGGVFMINCQWSDEELDHHLNAEAKKYIADNNIQLIYNQRY